MLCLGWNESAKEIYSIFVEILLNFRRNGNTLFCRYANKNRILSDFLFGGRVNSTTLLGMESTFSGF